MTAQFTIDPQWVGEATGVVAVVAIAVALIASARVRSLTRTFGIGPIYGLHRWLGFIALAAVVLHIVAVLWQKASNWHLLVPWLGTSASKSADVSTVALAALIASAMWRRRRNYDLWRRWHLALGALTTGAAALHVVFLDHMLQSTTGAWWFALIGCSAVAAFVWRWAYNPMTSGAYTVFGVHAESPTVSTVTLTPKHGRHRPNRRSSRFRPGQFGWFRLTRHPSADHPYSFSSSAHDARRVQVTVKRGGDFTERLVNSTPGQPVWLDGPHGSFSPPDHASGLVLIAAGVGITPMMSMLRTCADRRDRRPIRLVHAVDVPAEFVFHREISRLADVLNLHITPMVTHSHPDWHGLTGHIDLMLLDQVLPGQPMRAQLDVFVCGPPPMVSDTVAALVLAGVPRSRIHTESFQPPTPKGKPRAQHARATSGDPRRHLRRSRADHRNSGGPDTLPFPIIPDQRRW